MRLPDPLPIPEIRERLELIFPEGTPDRTWFVRDMAAKVVYVMVYVGAVEGQERWLGPKHIYCMGDEQAQRLGEEERLDYSENAWKAGFKPSGKRWYADTTREPIRDETLRLGLAKVGAVIQRDVPTTSSKPRYALQADFAALFSPSLQEEALREAISEWQKNHLDPLAMARIELLRQGAASLDGLVPVTFPNQTARQLVTGPSAVISKAVVTAYRDRNDPAFKKTFGSLAWNSIVWFLAEPDQVVILRGRPALEQRRIFDLLNETGTTDPRST